MLESTAKLIPESAFAKALGVTPRTLYSWERKGVIPPAVRINGRKYRHPDTLPRFDANKRQAA